MWLCSSDGLPTAGKFAIGQRAFLLETPSGNVLWDLISLLDDATEEFVCSWCPPTSPPPFQHRAASPTSRLDGDAEVRVIGQIKSKGGLKAIVISHPHFYTTYAVWARAFNCPVYTSAEDEVWFCRTLREPGVLRFVTGDVGASKEVAKGVTAV